MGEQLGGGGGNLHTHGVDALLHHPVQGGGQLVLLQIVLVLAHADGFRVDLHQLGQGILHAAGDGNGAALGHVEIGEFRRRQFAGGIDGGPGLADDHVSHAGQLRQQGHDELLAFSAGGAVADGDGGDAVLFNESFYQLGGGGFPGLRPRQGEMTHACVQHLAVFVDDGQLAARAEAGVHAQGHFALDGGLHEQLMQVLREYVDGLHVGPVGQFIADFPLQGGEQEPLPRVVAGQSHLLGGGGVAPDEGVPNRQLRLALRGDE